MSPGDKGKGKGFNVSKDTYFDSNLRPEDAQNYSSAGLLIHRKGENGTEILVVSEKPWNPFTKDYDALAWNAVGSRKTGGNREWDSAVTAARCSMEIFGGCEGAPSASQIELMCHNSPAIWYPQGKFVMYVHEYQADDGDVFLEAPSRFAAAKEKGLYPFSPAEERVNSKGEATTRWVKQIEELEWVPAADLLQAEPRKPLTNLMENICKIEGFRAFLDNGVLPASPTPPPKKEGKDEKGEKGKGKSKGRDKGGKKGGGGGKGGDWKGNAKGKGMWAMPGMMPGYMQPPQFGAGPPPPPMNPQVYPAEMQRQMLGEKMYLLVQPMVPSPMIAQKVTGMLLELPMPELMPLLAPGADSQSMLKERVREALQVLENETQ
jgi:hypothetical protein